MSAYFLAVLLLSGAAFIHSKSAAPELRPAAPLADRLWRWLGRACFWAWLGLLVWGAVRLHWSQPLAGLLGSLGFNALLARIGPRPIWPGLSMLCGTVGLLLGGFLLLR